MDRQATRVPIHVPDPISVQKSQLTAFQQFCRNGTGEAWADERDFHRFSIEKNHLFWRSFLDWSALLAEGDAHPVRAGDSCETASFFPALRLNYAENLLGIDDGADGDLPALTACHDGRPTEHFSRAQLRERVEHIREGLHRLGLRPGDRVVTVAYNNAEAILLALAVTSLGAVFSTAAPEMGAASILNRFSRLVPSLLICNLSGVIPPGDALETRIVEIVAGLPSLTAIVALDEVAQPDGLIVPFIRLAELEKAPPGSLPWPRFPFNHPLFILFSSGTTGAPKCLIHGAGGTLLEHVKEHRLHCDMRRGDKLLFQTSCAWMMWNWQLSALASGVEIVCYDGPISAADTMWNLVEREKVTIFGTSAAYLQLSQAFGLSPRTTHGLESLRSILSTGSILYDEQYDWVRDEVKDLPLQSISGGTDIVGCFVLGNPNLPVFRGESQCRSLGYDVQVRGVGELVCCNPFPSRPIGLYGDVDGARFHAAYFSQNEGVWTQGDIIEITAEGSVRLHGRSDGVLNIRGIRIGPAEIYRVVLRIPPIREALAIEQKTAIGLHGDARMVLLVVLQEPAKLDAALIRRIKSDLARAASSAHVPDIILQVPALPITHSGKLSERAARDAVNGLASGNHEALRNPECLELIRNHPGLRQQEEPADSPAGYTSIEAQLQAMWEKAFQMSPIEHDANFFDLGGDSLQALVLVAQIRRRFGRDLPLSTLIQAPTIAGLAEWLRGNADMPFSCLVPLQAGNGDRPFFIIHGMFGNVLDLKQFALRLRTGRPIYALQALGLDPAATAHRRVEDMADHYLREIRSAHPRGPYALAGHSFGGLVAFEMARRLQAEGEEVELLALFDTDVDARNLPWPHWCRFQLSRILRIARTAATTSSPLGYIKSRFANSLRPVECRTRHPLEDQIEGVPRQLEETRQGCLRAMSEYKVRAYRGRITYFRAVMRESYYCDPLPIWRRAAEGIDVRPVTGTHMTMMRSPHVLGLAETLSDCLGLAGEGAPLRTRVGER